MIRNITVFVLLLGVSAVGPAIPEATAANPGAKAAAAGATSAKRPRYRSAKTVRKKKTAKQNKLDAAAAKADRDMTGFLDQINLQRDTAQKMGNRFSMPRTPEVAERAHTLMANHANTMRAMAVNRRATLREFAAANDIPMRPRRPRRAAPIELDPPPQTDSLAVPAPSVRPSRMDARPDGMPLTYQTGNRRADY